MTKTTIIRLDEAHDAEEAPFHDGGRQLSDDERDELFAAIERESPGYRARMDAGQPHRPGLRLTWQPSDRELALAYVATSGLDPTTFRPVAGSMPVQLRSDEYVAHFGLARARAAVRAARSRVRVDQIRRDEGFVWPNGYDRASALAALDAAGVTVAANGVPFSSCADLAILGALSVLTARKPEDAVDEEAPTEKDRRRAARELQRADGLKDAPTEAERERRIEHRARKIARDRAYAARVAPVYKPK
ncbi:MAG: hypothetical protein SFX73_14045 [Kofleriaceae bacterium]|nr:hypothetical protein [Kofleriaceae bacterium]